MDRDTESIGGVANPLQPTKQLFYISILMDVLAIILSYWISTYFAVGICLYIAASRAYSYRGIRLKKYPVMGYLTVVVFQGAFTFFLSYHACNSGQTLNIPPLLGMIASSTLIGGYYPLTQIYQHQADAADEVTTISMKLGKRGTFIFCGGMFAIATLCIYLLNGTNGITSFYLFILCMTPLVWFFVRWMRGVWKDEHQANFKNSLYMNILAACCTTIYFLILIVLK